MENLLANCETNVNFITDAVQVKENFNFKKIRFNARTGQFFYDFFISLFGQFDELQTVNFPLKS
jgi:hypothetical protein